MYVFLLSTSAGERCVYQCELSVVDWQEGAAGMWLAVALCGTRTNRSIFA